MTGKNEQKVTSLQEIKDKAAGQVVELPGWDDDPVFFRLQRPAMAVLVKQGKIPNGLLNVVESLFEVKDIGDTKKESPSYKQYAELLCVIAEAALVEPAYADVQDLLTDEQLLEIYQYTQGGLAGLRKFRERQEYLEQIMSYGKKMGKAADVNAGAKSK